MSSPAAPGRRAPRMPCAGLMGSAQQARYLGIDLAWGQRARTGLAVLDGMGVLIDSRSVRSDAEIAAFVHVHESDTVVAAIDAPLIVPNDSGRRPCEAQVGALFARYRAGAYPANRRNPHFNPPRGARLSAQSEWDMDPRVRPAPGTSVCIEVYPHPGMVSLFGLDTVIPYKLKAGRELPALKEAYDRLLGHLEVTCGQLLRLDRSARWEQLRRAAEAAERKCELDAIEDEVDAIFCSYLAWLWANDPDCMQVLGDVHQGYIVTPTLPPRRT